MARFLMSRPGRNRETEVEISEKHMRWSMSRTQEGKGPVVMYIMGSGRSGSTLLDTILNNHPLVTSVGAAVNLPNCYFRGHSCACGCSLDVSRFWNCVLEWFRDAVGSEGLDEPWVCQSRVERPALYRRSDHVSRRDGELNRARPKMHRMAYRLAPFSRAHARSSS